jgi:hypothetical protein
LLPEGGGNREHPLGKPTAVPRARPLPSGHRTLARGDLIELIKAIGGEVKLGFIKPA